MKRALFVLAALLLSGRARAEECATNRPTDPSPPTGYAYGVAAKSYATPEGNARVWWTETGTHAAVLTSTRGDGVPDSVAAVGEVLENAVAGYAKMGFKAALRDGDYPGCASNGGDGRLDVYLVSFTGADGQTISERCTTVGTTQRCPGFMLVEANFLRKGYASAREGAQTVVAHEYFHMVQNAYDQKMDRWWAEGTAQWSTKQLYPELLDLERNLPAFFSEVNRPIDTPPSGVTAGFLYGAAIWPVFLAKHQGDDSIRLVMDAVGAGKGTVLPATDEVLATRGTTLADEFGTFAVWNAATGPRASADGYPNAAKYPQVKAEAFPDGLEQLSGVTAGFAARYYTTTDPTERTLTLEADETRLGAFAVPIEGGKVMIAKAAKLPTKVTGEAMIVLYGRSAKKTDVPWKLVATAGAVDADAGVTPPSGNTDSGGSCGFGHTSGAGGLLVVLAMLGLRLTRPSARG